jgi:hypothetical protein
MIAIFSLYIDSLLFVESKLLLIQGNEKKNVEATVETTTTTTIKNRNHFDSNER